MRRRLILLVFSTTLFALTLLGVILIVVIWTATSAAQQPRAEATAKVAANGLEDVLEAGGTVDVETLRSFVRDEAVLSATLPDGTQLSTGELPTGDIYTGHASVDGISVTAVVDASVTARHLREQVRAIPIWTLAYDGSDGLARLVAERIALNAKDAGETFVDHLFEFKYLLFSQGVQNGRDVLSIPQCVRRVTLRVAPYLHDLITRFRKGRADIGRGGRFSDPALTVNCNLLNFLL